MAAVTSSAEQTPTRRQRVLDLALRLIDTTSGVIAFVCGVFVFIAPPPTILREVSLPWLIAVWGVFLILGGLGSAVGRMTGVWLVETTGIVFLVVGILVYFAVVSTAIVSELGVTVAAGLILVAGLLVARRYVELQIFTARRGNGFASFLQHAFAIRTTPAR